MADTVDILSYIDDRRDGRGQFSRRCLQLDLTQCVWNPEQSTDAPDPLGSQKPLFTLNEIRRFFAMKRIRMTEARYALLG